MLNNDVPMAVPSVTVVLNEVNYYNHVKAGATSYPAHKNLDKIYRSISRERIRQRQIILKRQFEGR